MLVKDLTFAKAHFIANSAPIEKAIVLFKEQAAEFLLVRNQSDQLIGIISKEQILDAYQQQVSVQLPVECILDRSYVQVKEDQPLEKVFEKSHNIVVLGNDGKVKGILSKKIFLESYLDTLLQHFYDQQTDDELTSLPNENKLIRLFDQLNELKNSNQELNEIIEASSDSIYVTDGRGNTLRANIAFEKMAGVKRKEVLGKNAKKLEKEGLFYPSVSALVMKEKRKITIIQKMRNGREAVVTGVPVYDTKGNIFRIVCNSKDFEDLKILNEYLGYKNKKPTFNKNDDMSENSIIYKSQKMKELIDLIQQIATVDSTILFTGESGVGKGVIARLIHQQSNRANEKLIEINCGAIPDSLLESELFGYESGAFTGAKTDGKPGLLEIANKGTVFLDEIGEMPLNLQVKLLQVIQNRQIIRVGGTKLIDIDIRIIAATNKDLKKLIEEGKFRHDLFYRLNVVPLHIFSLRERKDDIIPLIDYFLHKFNKQYHRQVKFTEDLYQEALVYEWPGNIRELENFVERMVVTNNSGIIKKEDLPPQFMTNVFYPDNQIVINKIMPLKQATREVERQLVHMAYKISENSYKIASILGISQSSAHRKIQEYIQKD
ncbi:PAS domain S-box-containing protein [Desulfotomaculum arcticum]|uniref:PAS domain S-box-containing protein n=1 Tax=Desulfotruncus arcticus DSM 17038 TaxID=1121424 RepID=A0A1I2PGM0_9FIRM|nr:sigma 54-interacting transcriptional regulator [Desulfotruncus arcticus]SFG14289.1 PAS domain S-box-containing protein [Desulfotomaculum arcticum] [Desulfotruncus arcticus DSM 17038]